MTMRQQDRRALLVLGIFLILAAGYVFWYEPLVVRLKRAHHDLESRKHDLLVRHQRVRELASWQHDYQALGTQMAAWRQLAKAPPYSSTQAHVLETLRLDADQAQVQLTSLRPEPRLLDDGVTEVVDTFAIEGQGNSLKVADFLGRLWGMDVMELQIARGDDASAPTTFYLQARLLPLKNLDGLKLPDTPAASLPVVAGDAFVARQPPPPPPPKEPPAEVKPAEPEPAPPPKAEPEPEPAAPTVEGLSVIGVGKIGDQTVGVFMAEGDRDLIMVPGDTYNGYKLIRIEANGADFEPPKGGQAIHLGLPPSTAAIEETAAGPATPAAPATPPQPAHLGLSVRALTAAPGPGLEVTKVDLAGSPAQKGDVIFEAGSTPVHTLEDLARILRAIQAGDSLPVRVHRDGKDLDLQLPTH